MKWNGYRITVLVLYLLAIPVYIWDLVYVREGGLLTAYFLFPLIALIACLTAGMGFSPKISWIFPAVSYLVEIFLIRQGFTFSNLLRGLECPTLLGPFVGYAIGIIIYIVRYAVARAGKGSTRGKNNAY